MVEVAAGRRVVSGPGVACPKSRLLWGARPVTLDVRGVPAMSSRARQCVWAGDGLVGFAVVGVSRGCRFGAGGRRRR